MSKAKSADDSYFIVIQNYAKKTKSFQILIERDYFIKYLERPESNMFSVWFDLVFHHEDRRNGTTK